MGISMDKAEYRKYLQSQWWQGRSRSRTIVAGHRCEFRPVVYEDKHGGFHGERCPVLHHVRHRLQ
jgi:hypothetical protein